MFKNYYTDENKKILEHIKIYYDRQRYEYDYNLLNQQIRDYVVESNKYNDANKLKQAFQCVHNIRIVIQALFTLTSKRISDKLNI